MDAVSFLRSNHSEGGERGGRAGGPQICIAAEFVGPSNECISLCALGSFIDLLPFLHKGISQQVVMTEALLQLHSKSTLQTSGCIFKKRRRASLKPVQRNLSTPLCSRFSFLLHLRGWSSDCFLLWSNFGQTRQVAQPSEASFSKTLSSRHLFRLRGHGSKTEQCSSFRRVGMNLVLHLCWQQSPRAAEKVTSCFFWEKKRENSVNLKNTGRLNY